MGFTHTGMYRTVVKTTFTTDSTTKHRVWNRDTGEYDLVPVHKAGEVVTEVFGPYINSAQSQNYSMIGAGYFEDTDELRFKREDYAYFSDTKFEELYGHRKDEKKERYVSTSTKHVQHQKLAPVFAFQQNGTLALDLDWVMYGN